MRFLITTGLCLFILSACSLAPSKPNEVVPHTQSSQPIPENWRLSAKLGIRAPDQNGSVSLTWEQLGPAYQVQVQAPLGQGSAVIYGRDKEVVIERPGKPSITATDNEYLLKDTLGWSFPLNDLKFWVRGIANPDTATQSLQQNPTGTLDELQQSQWTISYSRYQQNGQWLLPGKIVAQKDDTRLTLIIRQWQLY